MKLLNVATKVADAVHARPKILYVLAAVLVVLLLDGRAWAQTVSAGATFNWTLPTTSTDGVPLTGANALTSVQVFVSTSPIPDSSTMAPTATLGAGATTSTRTVQVVNGGTIYGRIKACNAGGCSAFSTQVSKQIQLSTTPGIPTSVTIEIQIQTQ